MKLDKFPPQGRAPLRTVSEIADMLGIERMQLVWALKRDGAPTPALRGSVARHVTGQGRVWYEPCAVIKWWREFEATDPAAARRQYHREYAARRKGAPNAQE